MSFAIALASDSAWGLLASTVRAWFARCPRRRQLVGVGGRQAMTGLGRFAWHDTGHRIGWP